MIPVATITCAGKALDPSFEVLEIEVRRELNRIPEARLVLLDGNVAEGRFQVSDGDLFVPGKEVSIALRYEGSQADTQVFKGLVVRHGVESGRDGSRLRVELKDAAFKLTRQRRSAVYREMRDDEVVAKLVRGAGLKVGALASGSTVHKELVQYHASDWDFIVARADVQGLVVDVHQGQVSLAAMQPVGASKAHLTWGMDEIYEFDLRLDGAPQWAELESVAWDLAAQKLRGPEKARQPSEQGGNLKPKGVAQALGGDRDTLLHAVDMDATEMKAWADARLLRSRLAFLRGRVVISGDAKVVPLDLVELAGVGQRFNGRALVSGVVHRMHAGGWTTEWLLGLSAEAYARRPDIAELPAAGLLPPVSGLQVALVAGFQDDPSGENRIRLKLPALDDQQGEVWARLLRPDAGKDRGMAFWPEAGDEVVIGFLDGDPRQPIVLGAMYGSVNTPPAYAGKPSDDNKRRALVSRAGAVIGFDDEKVQISITTPGGQEFLLDDDAKQITLKDQHGNQISLNDKGITLKSASDFTIDASGKVVIKGAEVDVQ